MEISTKQTYPNIYNSKVAVIGLGYVGLPLAIEIALNKICHFSGKNIKRKVVGFDINQLRIAELKSNNDITSEVSSNKLKEAANIKFTTEIADLFDSDFYIVTVPTPIDKNNKPDLKYLKMAAKSVGLCLEKRNKSSIPLVIFESTVYPGATEEVCIPIIEKYSKYQIDSSSLKQNIKKFCCGYSPERINPGDKTRNLVDIVKITSGSSSEGARKIDEFYKSFISAGTFPVSSIKIAEAAKVIENTQRDVNIALVNELSLIFRLMNIDTHDVLEAAGTKWNFLPFKPGLVGGHCIGVDPYYLTYKAAEYGYHAEVVLSGRKTNENMAKNIADSLIVEICKQKINISSSRILIMGVTFKENCPDIRNSKVFDIAKRLEECNMAIDLYDPIASKTDVRNIYNYSLIDSLYGISEYSSIIVAVAHDVFSQKSKEFWLDLINKGIIIFDVKSILPRFKNILRL